MAYFSEAELETIAESPEMEKRAARNILESFSAARLSIFLSHSHTDKKIVEGWIRKLALLGVEMYVDWNDSSMPRETNRETADKIKQRISEVDLFVVLATNAALESKWVSWEIGIADQAKGESKVLLAPVVPKSGTWEGNEYLQLYRTIQLFDTGESAGKPGVIRPNANEGPSFRSYAGKV
jgi:hypothetical protein